MDGNNQLCTLAPGYGVPVCGPSLAPALIFGPVASIPSPPKGKTHVAAIAGGVAGAAALVFLSAVFVACCLVRAKSWPSATSDTGSSDPSAQGIASAQDVRLSHQSSRWAAQVLRNVFAQGPLCMLSNTSLSPCIL